MSGGAQPFEEAVSISQTHYTMSAPASANAAAPAIAPTILVRPPPVPPPQPPIGTGAAAAQAFPTAPQPVPPPQPINTAWTAPVAASPPLASPPPVVTAPPPTAQSMAQVARVPTSSAVPALGTAPMVVPAPAAATAPGVQQATLVARPVILVTGATGNVGSAVVNALLATGSYYVRVLTRYPQSAKAALLAQRGCEVVQGDMGDLARMRQAVRDCYGVFSMQNPIINDTFQPEQEIIQGCNVADACKFEGVRHLVQLSWCSADRAAAQVPFFASKWAIEQHIRGLELPYTILRSAALMENWLTGIYRIRKKRVTAYPSADVRDYYTCAADLGIFTELAFRRPNDFLNRTMDIAGDYLNGLELAAVFSRVSPQNGPFRYKMLPRFLLKMAYPQFYLWSKWLDNYGHSPIDLQALRAYHPGLRTVEMWARENGFATRVLGESDCAVA